MVIPMILSKTFLTFNKFVGQKRRFTAFSSQFGTDFLHGPKEYDSGVRLGVLPKEAKLYRGRVHYLKFPKELSRVDKKYFFPTSEEVDNSQFRQYFHFTMNDKESCIIGSTKQETLRSPSFMNQYYQRSRGFAIQLVVTGKGMKVAWENEYPHLILRRNATTEDFTNAVIRIAETTKIVISKTGQLITVYGYNKAHVEGFAHLLSRRCECHKVSQRGVYIGGFPIRKVVRSTKKK